jgi:hypothetical protein
MARTMPRRHLQFLSQLQLTFTCGDFFVVRPGVNSRRMTAVDS